MYDKLVSFIFDQMLPSEPARLELKKYNERTSIHARSLRGAGECSEDQTFRSLTWG